VSVPSSPGGGSLRARLLAIGVGTVGLGLVLVTALALFASGMQRRLALATESVIEEQQIADRVTTGVMRQLATISTTTQGGAGDATARTNFDAAGAAVNAGVRAYLFRELSVEERMQLERVRAEHNAMEVAALAATNVARADTATRRLLQEEATGHALGLLDAMDGFLRLREEEYAGLARSQAMAVRRLWLVGGGLVLGIAALASFLLVGFTRRRITDPLEILGEVSTQVGQGNLAVRVPPQQDREFAALASSFNLMSERLSNAQAALEARNHALEQALEEIQRAQGDLLEAEKLGAVGRMTAGLAHELNNPLASVLGLSRLLEAELAEDRHLTVAELRERFVEPIVAEASRARHLVRSLLHFARRGGGAVGSVAVRGALDVVLNLRRHAFEQGGVTLTCASLPDVCVSAEPQQLQAIFLNIISNALDALRDRPAAALHVKAEVREGMLWLRFEDNGPGLQEPDRVFEPFYTTKPVGEGTGLGLSLSRRFVEAFGGTMRAQNRPGGGACISVGLPITDAPPTEMSTAQALRRAPRSATAPYSSLTMSPNSACWPRAPSVASA
jgi:C4-dicarboxylate-specific signal transduction histidine kinase